MSTTLRYELFGTGKPPHDLHATLEPGGLLDAYEGVPVHFAFSGELPGLSVHGTHARKSRESMCSRSWARPVDLRTRW